MSTTHIAFIAKQTIPIEFNSIVVREDGTLERQSPGRPVEFRFVYAGIPFDAHAQYVGNQPVLHLSGEVGPVPYSAESIPVRRASHAVLRASWTLPHSRLVAWPGGRIRAIGKMPLPAPLTPVGIITAVTSMILDLKPYLDLIAELLPMRFAAGPNDWEDALPTTSPPTAPAGGGANWPSAH